MTPSRFARTILAAIAMLATFVALTPAQARTHRSGWARAAFVAAHPCPGTGRPGPCPGYVVDHVRPLCAGGLDRPQNMAWQRRADAVRKDRAERALCLAARSHDANKHHAKKHHARRRPRWAQCAGAACAPKAVRDSAASCGTVVVLKASARPARGRRDVSTCGKVKAGPAGARPAHFHGRASAPRNRRQSPCLRRASRERRGRAAHGRPRKHPCGQ